MASSFSLTALAWASGATSYLWHANATATHSKGAVGRSKKCLRPVRPKPCAPCQSDAGLRKRSNSKFVFSQHQQHSSPPPSVGTRRAARRAVAFWWRARSLGAATQKGASGASAAHCVPPTPSSLGRLQRPA